MSYLYRFGSIEVKIKSAEKGIEPDAVGRGRRAKRNAEERQVRLIHSERGHRPRAKVGMAGRRRRVDGLEIVR